MQEELLQVQDNVPLLALAILVVLSSSATWLWLLTRWTSGKPALQFAPRHPVPWGPYGMLLAFALAMTAVGVALFQDEPFDLENSSSDELVRIVALGAFQVVVLTALFTGIVVGVSKATRYDIGFAEYVPELIRDFRIGFVAWLAALLPVYGTQSLLVFIFGEESQHPLIHMIISDPNPLLLMAAFFSAVVVAPICEELTFRLFLQGYLEKWEHQQVAEPKESMLTQLDDFDSLDAENTDEPAQPLPIARQPEHGVFGLPNGWFPIVVSATLFSLAHLGHGPDPIAIFVLALVMGYVYQRTHRITPCIVLHMLFNAFSLVALGLMVYGSR